MKTEYGTGEIVLLQTLDYFRQRVIELEGAVYETNELNKVYDALHKDYVQKCAEYNALNKTYEAFNADFDKMCEERDAAVTEAIYLRENYKVLAEETEDWKSKYENQYDKLVKLERENEELTIKLEISNEQYNDLKRSYGELKEDYTELEEEYNDNEKAYNDLYKKVKKLQAENDQHLREWSLQHVEKQAAERLATDMESNYQNLLNDYNELYTEKEKLEGTIRLLRANQNILVEENEKLKGLLHAETKLDESLDKYMESWEKAGY